MSYKNCESGKRDKILFILHLPPPIHGAAIVGQYIKDSKILNSFFYCNYINLALARDLTDIGKSSWRKFFSFAAKLVTINKIVRQEQPNLVYVTPSSNGGAFYKDFIVILLLKILKQNIVIHYHNKGISLKQDKWLNNLLYKNFFPNLKVILLTYNLYYDIKKYVGKKDLFICPNGIPLVDKVYVQSKKCSNKFPNILFLSNMMQEKGVWDLLSACDILKKRGIRFNCNFVGKWSDISESDFNNKLIELNLNDHVTAHGAKYDLEKYSFFMCADVFVFPSHNETFGLVLLEAMQWEIPCIGTNEGGIPDIIKNKETGLIVPKKNPFELANAIEEIIMDEKKSLQMGQAGRRYVEEYFTLDKFENRMKTIFQDCINR